MIFSFQVISSCGTGEKSPNTLYIGLILNSVLLSTFFIVLFYFNNRRHFKFYFALYIRSVRNKRTPSQRYNLSDGLRLAIDRLPKPGLQDNIMVAKKDGYNISFEKLCLTLTSVSLCVFWYSHFLCSHHWDLVFGVWIVFMSLYTDSYTLHIFNNMSRLFWYIIRVLLYFDIYFYFIYWGWKQG